MSAWPPAAAQTIDTNFPESTNSYYHLEWTQDLYFLMLHFLLMLKTTQHNNIKPTQLFAGDGSVVKSVCYSFRGPEFDSQHPQSSVQPSVTPVLGTVVTQQYLLVSTYSYT